MERRQRLDLIHKHPSFATVERILIALNQAGYQAVLAGGSVRDALLGVNPKDLDVATSAPPEAVEGIFRATLAVGKAFGTIIVVENGYNFEVTTFRREGPYLDGRRPSHVEFATMAEDAQRRDFTVNALYYDPLETLLYDYVGGLSDLEAKILRTVGVPQERFEEDHLRLLRAVRFVSQLGFQIESATLQAIRDLHELVKDVSAERVLNEMQKLLMGPHLREALKILVETRLHSYWWPEVAYLEDEKLPSFLSFLTWENAFAAIMLLVRADPEPRLKQWKASRESIRKVKSQMTAAETLVNERSSKAERIQALGGPEYAETLVLASGILSLKNERHKLESWIEEYLSVAGPNGELPPPLVSGEDLKAAGVPPSPQMGEILKKLYANQLEGKLKTKEEALGMLSQLIDARD